MKSNNLDIISFNLSINNGDVERRMHDFTALMLELSPNIVIAQEVSSDVGRPALQQLTASLGPDYTMHYERVYPGQKDSQGVAVISALPVRSSRKTESLYGRTQVQIVEIGSRYGQLVMANVHLEAAPKEERGRIRKLQDLEIELDDVHGHGPRIVAGDFNALPFFPSVRSMTRQHGYTSAYRAVHDKEPDFTFPNFDWQEMLDGRYIKPDQLIKLRRLGKIFKWLGQGDFDLPHYVTDYVFYKNLPRPVSADLIVASRPGGKPISDHSGHHSTFPAADITWLPSLAA
jgi:endonuclease/exonuclease/phosphatase family metal-dependent hydrolase